LQKPCQEEFLAPRNPPPGAGTEAILFQTITLRNQHKRRLYCLPDNTANSRHVRQFVTSFGALAVTPNESQSCSAVYNLPNAEELAF
jgi:hypothetical protein